MLPLNPKLLMIGVTVIALGVGVICFCLINVGRSYERARSLQATMDTIKQRDRINGKVNRLSDADLCAQLGGVWVSENCQ